MGKTKIAASINYDAWMPRLDRGHPGKNRAIVAWMKRLSNSRYIKSSMKL